MTMLVYNVDAGQAQVIALAGDLETGTVATLELAVTAALRSGHRHVILDLFQVTQMSTSTLSFFCGALRRLHRRGGALSVAGAQPNVRDVFEHAQLAGLGLHPTVTAALRPASRLVGTR